MANSEVYGDWDEVKRILRDLNDMDGTYEDVIVEMGHKIADKVKELIASQSIYLEPLDKEYRQQKAKEGHDGRTLISTGDFLESIEVTDIQIGADDIEVFISIKDGVTETGISMRELAQYIEYGTRNQPARLPFTRSWEAMKSEVMTEVTNKLRSKIEDVLK